ncbi:MAG: hypothetical protein U9N78_06850 [Actinomycetota bacterium]|nr:hypothetical protein [Actinomycetota bacterium]
MSEYELVEFVEPAFREGGVFQGTKERVLGVYNAEVVAVDAGRKAWTAFRESGSKDVAWWVVRIPGETLARWIADGGSPVERVLDLRTNQLVELR